MKTGIAIVTQRLAGLKYSVEKQGVLVHAEFHNVMVVLILVLNLTY